MKKDKKRKPFKKFIVETLEEFRVAVYCGEYDMSINWEDKDENRENNHKLFASIDIDHTYLSFGVSIFPICKNMYENGKEEEVLQHLLHEICHLLTEPMYRLEISLLGGKNIHTETIEEIRERQTQRITNSIYRLWQQVK